MKTLRERFSLGRSNQNKHNNHNTGQTADLEGTSGASAGAHTEHTTHTGGRHPHDEEYCLNDSGYDDDKNDDDHKKQESLPILSSLIHIHAAPNHHRHAHINILCNSLRTNILLWCRLILPFRLVSKHHRLSKAIVVLICIMICTTDPPFVYYPVLLSILMTVAVQSFLWPCIHMTLYQTVCILTPFYMAFMLLFHSLAVTTEVKRVRSHSFNITGVNRNRHFYYMTPDKTDYDATLTCKIAAISEFVNKKDNNTVVVPKNDEMETNMNIIEPLPVSHVQLFDNAVRFDFLLEFIRNDHFTADFACLIESDVVVRTQYFMDEWRKAVKQSKGTVEFAYVQHAWGRVHFEAQNVGVLCVSKTASRPTIRWLRLMAYLNDRKYCRLLIKPLLYSKWAGLPDNRQHVFAWDLSGGCTVLRPYCNYIHFTRPKGPALDAAMKIVKAGTFDMNNYK